MYYLEIWRQILNPDNNQLAAVVMTASDDVDEGVEHCQHVALSNDLRQAEFHALLKKLRDDGRPQRGAFVEVAEEFGIHWNTAVGSGV